jgi:CRISPR-associated protein Cmr6
MVRPLYEPAVADTPSRDSHGHAGLWYDKFCDQWRLPTWTLQAGKSQDKGSNPKLDWINNLTGQPLGVANELEEISKRLIRLSFQQGGLSLVFRTESRFVTGLGRSHPVENGFAWHPTLGTPYLPGSSIKGMVRAWADQQAHPNPGQTTLTRLFGAPGQSGGLCFLDAVPIAPAKVEADVLTPHYAAWSPEDPPGDWRSPVPVPFLVTAEGLQLLFTVLPCGPLESGDLALVETWLTEALEWAGAGAKTAVGYGRFRLQEQKTEELLQEQRQRAQQKQQEQQEQERLDSLDPLDRELELLAAKEAATTPPPPPYRAWIKAVENGRWSDDPESGRLVLERIEAAMRSAGDWKEISEKKNKNKPDKKFTLTQKVKQLKAQLAR